MGNTVDVKALRKAIRQKQSTINKVSRKMKTAPKYIFAGWDSSSGNYPEQNGKPVEYIAYIHEHGLGGHTEKKMIKNTTHLHAKEWKKLYKKLFKAYIKKGKTPNIQTIYNKVGRKMRDDLTNYVYLIGLVDTERLANSVIVRYRRNKRR